MRRPNQFLCFSLLIVLLSTFFLSSGFNILFVGYYSEIPNSSLYNFISQFIGKGQIIIDTLVENLNENIYVLLAQPAI